MSNDRRDSKHRICTSYLRWTAHQRMLTQLTVCFCPGCGSAQLMLKADLQATRLGEAAGYLKSAVLAAFAPAQLPSAVKEHYH